MRLLAKVLTTSTIIFSLLIGWRIDAKEISLVLDEKISEINPMIINDRVMVPVRYVSESIGATVIWNETTQKILIDNDQTEIMLQVNGPVARLNNDNITLDAVPFIEKGVTYVPLRVVSEGLGLSVNWDAEKAIVFIESRKGEDFSKVLDEAEGVLEFSEFAIPIFKDSVYWDDTYSENTEASLEFVNHPFGMKIYNRSAISIEGSTSLQFVIAPNADVEKALAVIEGVLSQKIDHIKVKQVLEAIKVINDLDLNSSDSGIITAGKYQILVNPGEDTLLLDEDGEPFSVMVSVLY